MPGSSINHDHALAGGKAKLQPLWSPSEDRVASARMTQFMEYASARQGRTFANYDELYEWSITHLEDFWSDMWDFANIKYSAPFTNVLSDRSMPGAKWFEGARLNFAQNLLRYHDDHPALVGLREGAPAVRLTYRELNAKVAACAAGLRSLGVGVGDRVAGLVANVPEAVIAMLATTSLGALWSSCSPDFGLSGVLDRFSQIEPKVLFASDGYRYGGQPFDKSDEIAQISARIFQIKHVVVIPNLYDAPIERNSNYILWPELLRNANSQLEFEQLPFDHPVYIMYSSGTTGVPKCIVHGAGGTLLQHFKELALHTDLKRDDTICYFTTCGWMMWNWLISSLTVGATVVLYDGSPAYPSVDILWDLVEREKISVFGTSPRYLSVCQRTGVVPSATHRLDHLRTILSTGSPLSDDNFHWVYDHVKSDLQLSSISGGTDIISCFMLGNPLLPVYSGEIQCRGLGMKVEAWDNEGRSHIDTAGELVCTAPFPSMPTGFWNDPDSRKYHAAYFEQFPGVWRHGDLIRITPRGGIVVYGRSDTTLNPGGVRIGTAEIYNPVESMPEIADSLVIGQRWKDDIRIVLFVVPTNGHALTEDLKLRIRQRIREYNTPRHVPAIILPITQVPRTISGKKVELAVADVIHGQPITNRHALANPESLSQFANIPELQ